MQKCFFCRRSKFSCIFEVKIFSAEDLAFLTMTLTLNDPHSVSLDPNRPMGSDKHSERVDSIYLLIIYCILDQLVLECWCLSSVNCSWSQIGKFILFWMAETGDKR